MSGRDWGEVLELEMSWRCPEEVLKMPWRGPGEDGERSWRGWGEVLEMEMSWRCPEEVPEDALELRGPGEVLERSVR